MCIVVLWRREIETWWRRSSIPHVQGSFEIVLVIFFFKITIAERHHNKATWRSAVALNTRTLHNNIAWLIIIVLCTFQGISNENVAVITAVITAVKTAAEQAATRLVGSRSFRCFMASYRANKIFSISTVKAPRHISKEVGHWPRKCSMQLWCWSRVMAQ
jgi:hypothetical protein